MEVGVRADPIPEQARVPRHPGGARDGDGGGDVGDVLGQPQALVHPARARVDPGPRPKRRSLAAAAEMSIRPHAVTKTRKRVMTTGHGV